MKNNSILARRHQKSKLSLKVTTNSKSPLSCVSRNWKSILNWLHHVCVFLLITNNLNLLIVLYKTISWNSIMSILGNGYKYFQWSFYKTLED